MQRKFERHATQSHFMYPLQSLQVNMACNDYNYNISGETEMWRYTEVEIAELLIAANNERLGMLSDGHSVFRQVRNVHITLK